MARFFFNQYPLVHHDYTSLPRLFRDLAGYRNLSLIFNLLYAAYFFIETFFSSRFHRLLNLWSKKRLWDSAAFLFRA